MNEYCVDLNFPYRLLKEEKEQYSFPRIRHSRLGIESINPRILQIFNDLKLDISLVEIFYSKPFYFSSIHSDQDGGDINKINWIYGGKNCKMNWYSTKTNLMKESKKSAISTRYLEYRYSEVNLEFSKVLANPSLVHVGVPHNVQNFEEERWCVSIVYSFKNLNYRPTMQESLKLFQPYLLF